jgi:hypothetical protein
VVFLEEFTSPAQRANSSRSSKSIRLIVIANKEPHWGSLLCELNRWNNVSGPDIGHTRWNAPKLYRDFAVAPLTTVLCDGQTLAWKAGNPFL